MHKHLFGCLLGVIFSVFYLTGCGPRIPVFVELQDCNTGLPLSDVGIGVYPPVRWFPTLPEASGTTDVSGVAILKVPGEDRDTLWLALFKRKGLQYSFIFNASTPTSTTFQIVPKDESAGNKIRVKYWTDQSNAPSSAQQKKSPDD